MTTDARAKLDDTSRRAIARFSLRIVLSLVLAFALTGELSYTSAVAAWLAFYAVFAMGVGLLIQDTFAARSSFNYWDEAMWLLVSAWLMHALGRLVA